MFGFNYLSNVATLKYDPEKCTGCGVCVQVCPHQILARNNGNIIVKNSDACMECGACQKNCRFGAITVRSGVGCATAVINAALGRKSSSCCCVIEGDEDSGLDACGQGASRKSQCC
jgi:NAD-dependent dihydropyrimidine dehydrogenase PreA subunit